MTKQWFGARIKKKQARINNEFDKNKSQGNINKPAPDAVVFPYKMPYFLQFFLPILHKLSFGKKNKKVLILKLRRANNFYLKPIAFSSSYAT